MPTKQACFFALFALPMLGCGVETSLTRTGPKFPPRPEDCTFEIFTSPPNGAYVEVGTLDLTSGGTTNLGYFRAGIRPQVCKAGGDAALAIANGGGVYIKATILKRVEGPPPSATAPALSPSQPASGCSFDNQCKGDRICVQGTCTEPSPKK
jgi:hypothetical protein